MSAMRRNTTVSGQGSDNQTVTAAALPYAVTMQEAMGHLKPTQQAIVLLGLMNKLKTENPQDSALKELLRTACQPGGIIHGGQ